MLKSRQQSANFRLYYNLAIIIVGLIVIVSLLGLIWQQKTSQFVQAIAELKHSKRDISITNSSQQTSKPLDKPNTVVNKLKVDATSTITDKAVIVRQASSNKQKMSAVPDCQKISHFLPQPINLIDRPDGLTHIIDKPILFQVFGRDPNTIKQQIWRCSPNIGKSYVYAISQSRIDISFGQLNSPLSGTCKLTNVKVGLRTVVTLPSWQADELTPSTTKQIMTRFLNGVATHESGHNQIDRQYAEKLLQQLRNLSAPCNTLISEVQLTFQQIQNKLQTAQHAYELKTNYGANQGAWL